MNSSASALRRLDQIKPLARRGLPAVVAYLTTSACFLLVTFTLASTITPERLQALLVFVFVATLSAGIEPGTAKAALLVFDRPHIDFTMTMAMLQTSIIKALAVSPLLAGVWLISAPAVGVPPGILWSPVIAVLGFVVTDLRVVADARGHHANAIWIKQGSLAISILAAGGAIYAGAGMVLAIGLSCLVRGVWTVFWLTLNGDFSGSSSDHIREHLLDKTWRHLLLTAMTGSLAASIDRLVVFRLVTTSAANAYIVTYEVLSKFWLLPYLIVPVIFVETARGGRTSTFSRLAYLAITAAAIPYLIVAALLPLAPIPVLQGAAFPSTGLLLFAFAIVLTSYNQLLSGQLQGAGAASSATWSATIGLVTSLIIFPVLVHYFGVVGLFWAWLVKSAAEGIFLFFSYIRKVAR